MCSRKAFFGRSLKINLKSNCQTYTLGPGQRISSQGVFNDKDAALVVSIMWCIWNSRNKFVHGEQCYQPLKYFQLIEEHLANLELPVKEREAAVQLQKWQKPPVGWHPVNTDGSLDIEHRVAGSGFVIREDAGAFVHAHFVRQAHIQDPFLSELLGCREGLEAAVRKGLQRIIIQTDC